MRTIGTISLINYNFDVLSVRIYNCKANRDKIIKDWRKLYGQKFDNLIIQIAPFVPLKFDKQDIANTPYYGNVRKAAKRRRNNYL